MLLLPNYQYLDIFLESFLTLHQLAKRQLLIVVK